MTTATSVKAIFGDDWSSTSSTWYDAVGPVMSAVFQADLESKYFNPAISEGSPGVKAVGNMALLSVWTNAIAGKMQIWDPAFLDSADTELKEVDLSKVNVPTYLVYADDATDCSAQTNMKALKALTSVKRTVQYEGHDQLTFYKNNVLDSEDASKKRPSDDVIIILGSGAKALFVSAASALTLLSLI